MKKCKYCANEIQDDAIVCVSCGRDQRKIKGPIWKTIAFITNLATLLVAIAIIWQSYNLNRQTSIIKDSFELENRPYLYIDIMPVAFTNREKHPGSDEEYDNLYVGAELTYKNVGKLPACNINSEIHFYSDVDKGDNFERLKKYYIEGFGYFPEPTTIFPHQEGQKIVCRVDCSESTKDYLFTIRVTYTGKNPDKLYWYSTDVRYSIEKSIIKQKVKLVKDGQQIIQVPDIKEYSVYLINATSDYDRDGEASIPPVLSREDLLGG